MADEQETPAAAAEKAKAKAAPAKAAAENTAPEAPTQHIAEIGGGEYVAIGGGQVRRKDEA